MSEPLRIDLLRHGVVVGEPGYHGRSDPPLSTSGWRAMERAVARLAGERGWDGVISSDRVRCSAFARRLATALGRPLTIDPDLAEIDFGEWEGASASALLERDRQRLLAFWSDPIHHPPPGGEPLDRFDQRVRRGWQRTVDKRQSGRLLLVGHAGTIGSILAAELGLDLGQRWQITIEHAAVISLHRVPQAGAERFSLLFAAPGSDWSAR